MSTIHGLYANAITPVTPRLQSDTATNPAHAQQAPSAFTPVESNHKTSESKSSADQRPENDSSRDNSQNIQGEHNRKEASEKQEEIKAQLETKMEEQLITELKARDMEVRNHELAHQVVGGKYAGAIKLDYTRGPDGVNYATSGEVSISISPLNDPQQTIQKMQQIKQAALAPAEPSNQDRAVASMAAQIEIQAYTEMAKMERAEAQSNKESKEEIQSDDQSNIDRSEAKSDQHKNDEHSVDQPSFNNDQITSLANETPSIDTPFKSNTEYTSQPTGLNLNVIA